MTPRLVHHAVYLTRVMLLRVSLFSLLLVTGGVIAVEAEPPGPWAGFPRSQPTARYDQDVGAKLNYHFGVTKAFKPYVDPDRSEAEDLADPLTHPEFSSYNLIVIVNKRTDPFWGRAQTLRVYLRGTGLLYYWLISSGARGFETTSGYFTPKFFSSRHWSGKYDAPMLWAVFFHGGMALHSSLDRTSLKEMGRAAASHGCVHVEDYRAEELFHRVGHSGYGLVDILNEGTGRKTGRKAPAYKTLIIVAPTQPWAKPPRATPAGASAQADRIKTLGVTNTASSGSGRHDVPHAPVMPTDMDNTPEPPAPTAAGETDFSTMPTPSTPAVEPSVEPADTEEDSAAPLPAPVFGGPE
jgi:hypothetical protein